ncbi:protein-L-isoaspartate(D-aspartate) O-methyltransferase [bacterium]|nr:MAG: protein-L-isoaspartate(D-aspartate) O-methyltransferase [bacterium]
MFTNSAHNELVLSRKRDALIAELRGKGIQSESVLEAINKIPRHKMIDSALVHRAYEDTALPIMLRQTISQPYTVARQTELLELKTGEKVLEIGTGSGYQCAVLCELTKKVYSIERHTEMYHHAKEMLLRLGYRPTLKAGDGTLGWTAYAPFDAIVVTAGAPVVPEALIQQLSIGGRLVIPVGDKDSQTMKRIIRISETEFKTEDHNSFKFVPLIGKQGWQ